MNASWKRRWLLIEKKRDFTLPKRSLCFGKASRLLLASLVNYSSSSNIGSRHIGTRDISNSWINCLRTWLENYCATSCVAKDESRDMNHDDGTGRSHHAGALVFWH